MNGGRDSLEEMIERYRNELSDMRREVKAPESEKEPITPVSENQLRNSDGNTQIGYIKVQVQTEIGAPAAGATVLITSEDGGRKILEFFGFTDENGESPIVPLPAPPMENSEAPRGKNPYALYEVRTDFAGLRSVISRDVPVFEGVTSIQSAVMPPLPAGMRSEDGILIYTESAPNF